MLFYKFFTILLSYLAQPYLLIKLLQHQQEWKERLGLQKIPQQQYDSIWLHAASVGEFNAIKPVVSELAKKYYKKRIYITTITKTGHARAAEFCKEHPNVFNFFAPLDLPFAVKNFLKKLKPELVIITETELWPILIHYARKSNSRLILINGRMTKKSFQEYRRFSTIFKKTICNFDIISVQTKQDRARFQYFSTTNVVLCGNLKFAMTLPPQNKDSIKKDWKVSTKPVLTFGSTRPGEEELALKLSEFLNKNKISHYLIIVPRHLDRLEEVESLIEDFGLTYAKLSHPSQETDLMLVDSMGVLIDAYAISDIAIVGGSFYDFGGHNPLEPAYFGLPVIMGKFHSSCQKSVELLERNSAILISSKDKLNENVLDLINNENKQKDMGFSAQKTLQENKNSLDKTLELINNLL